MAEGGLLYNAQVHSIPWELHDKEEALIVTTEKIAEQAGAASPVLMEENFPSFKANFESLRMLSFKGVPLLLPLKRDDDDDDDAERYTVDEYLGTSWGASSRTRCAT